jgi:hypothetical protein
MSGEAYREHFVPVAQLASSLNRLYAGELGPQRTPELVKMLRKHRYRKFVAQPPPMEWEAG